MSLTDPNSTLPNQIPSSSDFFDILESGRHTVFGQEEQAFVERFARTVNVHKRDYRHLQRHLAKALDMRNYRGWQNQPVLIMLRILWQDTKNNFHLFCDVNCAAIDMCPLADENVYE